MQARAPETAERAQARSALCYRVEEGDAHRSANEVMLILLPGMPGNDELLRRAVRDGGWTGRTISLLPPRGIYHGPWLRGFTWFHVVGRDQIEPTGFVDSLCQLEQFVLDRLTEAPQSRLVLVGAAQGACLVLAAAPYLHDRIEGLIAIDGELPSAPWWTPPETRLDGLRIWLIRERTNGARDADATGEWLASRGANVECTHPGVDPTRTWAESLSTLRAWLSATPNFR